jgi:hypothetical protein
MEDILPARIRNPTLIFVSINSFKKEHLNVLKVEIIFDTNNDDIGRLIPLLPLLISATDYFSFQKILKNLESCFLNFRGFVLLFAESWLDSWILSGPAFSPAPASVRDKACNESYEEQLPDFDSWALTAGILLNKVLFFSNKRTRLWLQLV